MRDSASALMEQKRHEVSYPKTRDEEYKIGAVSGLTTPMHLLFLPDSSIDCETPHL